MGTEVSLLQPQHAVQSCTCIVRVWVALMVRVADRVRVRVRIRVRVRVRDKVSIKIFFFSDDLGIELRSGIGSGKERARVWNIGGMYVFPQADPCTQITSSVGCRKKLSRYQQHTICNQQGLVWLVGGNFRVRVRVRVRVATFVSCNQAQNACVGIK